MDTLRTSGATIQYSRTGRGPAVLMIQGVGVAGEGWRPQVEGLSDRFTIVTFDNRGMGGSTIDDTRRLTIGDMAADALAIMDAERLDTFHVVGHSMGGVIAQEVALRAPAKVKTLSLLCTFCRGKDATRMTMSMLATAIRTRVGTRAMRRNAFLELIMPARDLRDVDRPALATRLAPLFGHDLADQPPIVMKQLSAMSKYDAFDRLAALSHIPTLVVAAAADRIANPASGKVLADAIPGARYVELPDAGHGVTIHRAGDINRLLDEHFGSHKKGRPDPSGRPHSQTF